MTGIVREKVRRSFSSHAEGYDDHAFVQKLVIDKFISRYCSSLKSPGVILDVGAGTGRLLASLGNIYPSVSLVGVDLALGMARKIRERYPSLAVACSDAELLPFNGNYFDMVVSTSTYQWFENLDNAFAEAFRVLSPGGRFCFALFGGETLHELRTSYRQALVESGGDAHDRSHRFFALNDALSAMQRAGFADSVVEGEMEIEWHRDVKSVLASIKGIGAGSASKEKGRGLSGRKVIERMISNYEEMFRRVSGVPATYEIFYGCGVKR